MTTNPEYDDAGEVTEYIWRWMEERLTKAERVLGHAIVSARQTEGRRTAGLKEGPELDAAVARGFEAAWQRLEDEAAKCDQMAQPAIYRQIERKRPRGLPSSIDLRQRRLELQEIEEFRSEPLRFREKVAQRMAESGRVVVARCPDCACVVASPLAQQCRWCKSDWHKK